MIFRSDTPEDALRRFAAKLEVDPCHGLDGTACVLWTGAKTCGQGKYIKYGALKFQGQRWYAHRWAAFHIHGQKIEGFQVDHRCNRPLCMNHLQAVPPEINRELQWIRVQVGIEENPRPQFEEDEFAVPFYVEPDWYKAIKAL
jgi:hypothetical protein